MEAPHWFRGCIRPAVRWKSPPEQISPSRSPSAQPIRRWGSLLLDYLRGLAAAAPLELIVTGHSLGAALAVAATGWLHDQLGKLGQVTFTLWPHTFAGPTTWNNVFATWFGTTFTYYKAVNTNDIVPMAWADLDICSTPIRRRIRVFIRRNTGSIP